MMKMMLGFVAWACATEVASNTAASPMRTRHAKRFPVALLIMSPPWPIRFRAVLLFLELTKQLLQNREQLPRRCEARATARAHVLDPPGERAGAWVRLAAELQHERLPHRQHLQFLADCCRRSPRTLVPSRFHGRRIAGLNRGCLESLWKFRGKSAEGPEDGMAELLPQSIEQRSRLYQIGPAGSRAEPRADAGEQPARIRGASARFPCARKTDRRTELERLRPRRAGQCQRAP